MLQRRTAIVFLIFALLIIIPVQASLNRVASGAPVFVGEQNVDLTACLNGHSIIAWWPSGANVNTDTPQKVISVSGNPAAYYIDPSVFSGYTGTWYSYDSQPYVPVLNLVQPNFTLSVWDLDTNTDITGQTVLATANITYRIDTNLVLAQNYTYRPKETPADGFVTVTLYSPSGKSITRLFTGDRTNPTTQLLNFDSNPFVSTSPYFGKNLGGWAKLAKDTDGSLLYEQGTYTFVATQNLNNMSGSYGSGGVVGVTTSGDKTVTFIKPTFVATVTNVQPNVTTQVQTPAGTVTSTTVPVTTTVMPTTTVVAKRTTYTPLPDILAILGICIAGMMVVLGRKY